MNRALGIFALVFVIGGLGLGIVALATSNWIKNGEESLGFFQTCNDYKKEYPKLGVLCYNHLDKDHRAKYEDDTWYLATVGSHCGGVLFGFIGMVLWFAGMCTHRTGIRAGAIMTLILSFAGFLVGIILWKFKYVVETQDGILEEWTEGYSFWMAVGAAGGMGIATILTIVAAIAHRKK